jgi:predicted secreted Zn-dependent protease
VHPFSKHEILNKQFSAKHSSVLRVMTKWAQYLEDIFKHAEKHVTQRLYPFKTVYDEPVTIIDQGNKDKLIAQLQTEYEAVKAKFEVISCSSFGFMSKFLGEEPEGMLSNVCRYG